MISSICLLLSLWDLTLVVLLLSSSLTLPSLLALVLWFLLLIGDGDLSLLDDLEFLELDLLAGLPDLLHGDRDLSPLLISSLALFLLTLLLLAPPLFSLSNSSLCFSS